MFKLRLIAGRPDRLAKLLDAETSEVETSRIDETSATDFEGVLDDSPTDEMEVIPAHKDD
jgi:hypothetical protein